MNAGDLTSGVIARKKVMFLGDSCVGKASLVRKLCGQNFEARYLETLGLSIAQVDMLGASDLGSVGQIFDLWCCSGSARYLPLIQQNYAETSIFVLLYDVTTVSSLQRCVFWRNEISRLCPSAKIVLVGNKTDLEEHIRVTEENGQIQADSWGVAHYRISCKNDSGVNEFRSKLLL